LLLENTAGRASIQAPQLLSLSGLLRRMTAAVHYPRATLDEGRLPNNDNLVRLPFRIPIELAVPPP
jgi:hypothetical protein